MVDAPRRETAELLAEALQVSSDERKQFLRMARATDSADPGDDTFASLASLSNSVSESSPNHSTQSANGSHQSSAQQPLQSAAESATAALVVDTVAQRPLPTPPQPIVGRSQEIAQISALLSDPQCRMLTIVGAGGMGKTRLVLEVARREANRFAQGAVFVELSPLTSPDYLPSAVAAALGISSATQIDPSVAVVDYLARRQILLVLDNMEHLLAGAPFLSELLANTSQVTLLITSREHLNLSGEWVFEIQGLPVRRHVATNEQSGGASDRGE